MRCPRKKYCNVLLQTIETLKAHIMYHNFSTFYDKWVYHGEVETPVNEVMHEENVVTDKMIHVLDDFISGSGTNPVENDVDVGGWCFHRA